MKTVKAVLVTEKGRQPAILSAADDTSEPVLLVGGITYGPEDLPAGAYLSVPESDLADQATVAGFVLEPPHTIKRRAYRGLGKFYGVVLILGGVISLVWAVRDVLELDLLGALVWLGLAVFVGLLGLFWWFNGEQEALEQDAANRRTARRRFGSLIRRR